MLQTILKYAGIAYLIYLAAIIAMSEPVAPGQDNQRGPMTFWAAVLFQWVNVKGWVMAIGIITAYSAIASFPWNITIQAALRGPMTFWGAAMFQWVNAKGWVMVIGTITAYAAIASFPWNIAIQVAISLLLGVAVLHRSGRCSAPRCGRS